MARGQLINSIPELQIEWATKHPNESVRHFLIAIKGFTPRQYRHIISREKLISWISRREEIQNNVASARIKTTVDLAVQTHQQYYKASQVNLIQLTKKINQLDPAKDKSSDLLNLTKALKVNQDIALSSFGLPQGLGLSQILQNLETKLQTPHYVKSDNPAKPHMSYEEVVDRLKERRLRLK